jgi:hypothetical protein
MASKRDQKRDVPPANVGWLKQLVDEINVPFPPENEGWYTMSQICEETGRDHHFVSRLLRHKKAEIGKFRTTTSDGKTLITKHYRIA